MSKNKATYTLQIDAEVKNLEQKLGSIKGLLSNVFGSGQAPKGLEKNFEKVENILDQIRSKASQPITSKNGFTSITKDIDTAKVTLTSLVRLIEKTANVSESAQISFLPPDQQKIINEAVGAVEKYDKAIVAASEETKELVKAREKLVEIENKLKNARADKDYKEGELENARNEVTRAKDAIEAINKRKQALAELRAEQDKIEEFYNTPEENGQKRNRSRKYDGVSMRPQDIKKKITALETETAGDEEALNRETEALKRAKASRDSYIKTAETAGRVVNGLNQEYTEVAKKVEEMATAFQETSIQAQQDAFIALREEATNLGVSLEGIGESFTKQDSDELVSRITAIKDKGLADFAKNAKTASDGAKELDKSMEEMGDGVKDAAESYEVLSEEMRQAQAFEQRIRDFLGVAGAAQVLRIALRDAVSTIKELDSTMTEMAVVTDLTVGDYWDQLPQYSKQASDLGVSINSAYKAATLYYQQGLKGNEVTKISAQTLKMAKVAGLDAADATNKMTAALRGFNMELNETSAQRVADVYSELAAITAADVDEISSAMSKTASIASSAGMEFETTAAFLSQIIETTRESAETAGTALKTVIARFQELKKDPSEIGEVDGEIVDANKIETALRSVGVALRDSSGQFRDLDDVFIELSQKWNTLDTNTQRYIATIAAGSRQQSRFIAMMSDYGRTQELVASANNSAGASNRQFEKTMDSLDAKLEKLKNAWHEFTMGIMNSELVKTGVDILTKFLEIVNKATNGLDGLGGSITKILGILTVFKLGKTIFDKLRTPMINFFAEIVREAGLTGERAGRAAKEGLERSKQAAPGEQVPTEKKSWLGWTDVKTVRSDKEQARARLKELGSKDDIQANLVEKNREINLARAEITTTEKDLGSIQQLKQAAEQRKIELQVAGVSEEASEWENAEKALATANKGIEEHNEKLKKQKAELAQVEKEQEGLTNSLQEYNECTQTIGESGKKEWAAIGSAISQTGMAITGLGVGISMVSGLFASLGMEEVAEGFTFAGNAIIMLGGAMTALGPIISWIGTTFTIEGGKIAIAGTTAQLAWWWVLLIGVAIVGLIALTAVAINQIKKASPEEKLKSAQAAADAAGQAADAAAEKFDNLKNSLDSLKDSEDALNNLRRGTEEWQQAVNELNSSVLELVSEYPELASLVKSEGGVLTLDVDSAAVQDVLNKYETEKVMTKGAELGAKINVSEAQQQVDFAELEAVQKVANRRAAIGASAGLALSGIGGAVAGPIEAAATKNDESLQEAMEILSKDVLKSGDMSEGHIKEVLKGAGVIESEAQLMAEALAEDTTALLEFANATVAAEAQQKSYYQAMATQAQSLLDLGAYTEQEMNQISSVVGAERVKALEDTERERFESLEKEDKNAELQAYAESVYGKGAKVKDDKIVYYEDGEKKEAQINKEQLAQQMLSTKATEKAKIAMEAVTDALNNATNAFKGNFTGAETFGKVFSADEGRALNASELKALDEGKLKEIYQEMGEAGKKVWETEEEFIADYNDRMDKANKAFNTATKGMHKLGIAAGKQAGEIFGLMSAETATAWQKTLETINMGGGDVVGLQNKLDSLLKGLTEEQVNAAMAQINALDTADINAWKELEYVFDKLNIPVAADAMQNFIDKGIEASNAVDKIDIEGLNDALNNTYELIKKIKETSSRSYGEEDYKKIVNGNKRLEDQFIQIGDEFVYMGESINDLIGALEENTFSNLQEAARQLDSKIAFGGIAEGIKENNINAMDETQLRDYLIKAMSGAMAQGLDVADLGEQGFSNTTDLFAAGVDKATLLKWASAFAATGAAGQVEYNKELRDEKLREADIVKYSYWNTATENAAGRGSKYAEALQLQAIQSGGVPEELLAKFDKVIEALKVAEESSDQSAIDAAQAEVDALSGIIAESTEKIVESNEGRDAMMSLIDRVADALYEQGQKEIDKLQDIADATEEANSRLLDKIQEQIDDARQARENEETEKNLADLRSRAAYLGMDTSDANALALLDLEKQISEEEQAFQDTLVDQALQQLQDANEKAAEQRERQIDIAQQQLDWSKESGQIAQEAENIVIASLNQINSGVPIEKTSMGQILSEAETSMLSSLQKTTWWSELQNAATAASNWFTQQGIDAENAANKEARDAALADAERLVTSGKKYVTTGSTGGKALQNGAVGDRFASQVKQAEYGSVGLEGDSTPVLNPELERLRKEFLEAGGTQSEWDSKMLGFESDAARAKQTQNNNVIKQETAKTPELLPYEQTSGAPVPMYIHPGNVVAAGSYVNIGLNKNKTYRATLGEKITEEGNSYLDGLVTKYNTGDKHMVVANIGSGWSLYMRKSPEKNQWYEVRQRYNDKDNIEDLKKAAIDHAKTLKFKTGGLADFTGPAWLDGTKSKPEIVLNQRDSANFIVLRDILGEILHGTSTINNTNSNSKTGDNHFDIDINVEKIDNDYDVEQIADKIRRLIYEDASYRNVNAVGFIR